MKTSVVYLIHFDKPFSHAKHYLGSTNDVEKRLDQHKKGRAATITRAVSEAGIGMKVVRTWEGDKTLERFLKNKKGSPRLCPICCKAEKEKKNGT